MDVLPLKDGGLRFLDMPGAFFEQLSQLPDTCRVEDDPDIVRRLFPPPMDAEEEPSVKKDAEEDWFEYVQPELESAFDLAMQQVLNDLDRAKRLDDDDEEAYYQLEIPGEHVPSWFQVINRARIVLAIRYHLPFSEYPLESEEKLDLARLMAAQLSEHYAEILEILVHQMSQEID